MKEWSHRVDVCIVTIWLKEPFYVGARKLYNNCQVLNKKCHSSIRWLINRCCESTHISTTQSRTCTIVVQIVVHFTKTTHQAWTLSIPHVASHFSAAMLLHLLLLSWLTTGTTTLFFLVLVEQHGLEIHVRPSMPSLPSGQKKKKKKKRNRSVKTCHKCKNWSTCNKVTWYR